MKSEASIDVIRSEILRVRFEKSKDEQLRKFCNSNGVRRATFAYHAILDAMSAHIAPRHAPREGATKKPLYRKKKAPGVRFGGAPIRMNL